MREGVSETRIMLVCLLFRIILAELSIFCSSTITNVKKLFELGF